MIRKPGGRSNVAVVPRKDASALVFMFAGACALTIACLLAIASRDRWAPSVVAVAGGAGAGLFVDEVGKFITMKNGYSFPRAASTIYANWRSRPGMPRRPPFWRGVE